MFGTRVYSFAAPWLAGVMVMDALDFLDSLRFRTIVAQVLTDLTTVLVDTVVFGLVNQLFGVG
jgi:hypothetical protein